MFIRGHISVAFLALIVFVQLCCSFSAVQPVSPLYLPLRLTGSSDRFICQQVPGDGSCLFYAVTTALKHMAVGDLTVSRDVHKALAHHDSKFARVLRRKSVDVLKLENVTLDVGYGFPALPASKLLKMAADEFSVSSAEYCTRMLRDQEWGGGPEIIALCNYMQIPIHVYELKSEVAGVFGLRKEFGVSLSARFDPFGCSSGALGALNILHCDGRFPGIKPGEEQASGDHFMALIPATLWSAKRVIGVGDSPVTSSDVFKELIGKVNSWFVLSPSTRGTGSGSEWHQKSAAVRKKPKFLPANFRRLVNDRQSKARDMLLHLQKQIGRGVS